LATPALSSSLSLSRARPTAIGGKCVLQEHVFLFSFANI
jgi:hypothetical protein